MSLLSSANARTIIVFEECIPRFTPQDVFDLQKEHLLKIISLVLNYVKQTSNLYNPEVWKDALMNVPCLKIPTRTESNDVFLVKEKEILNAAYEQKFSDWSKECLMNLGLSNPKIQMEQIKFINDQLKSQSSEIDLEVIKMCLREDAPTKQIIPLIKHYIGRMVVDSGTQALKKYSYSVICYQFIFDYQRLEQKTEREEWEELMAGVETQDVTDYEYYYSVQIDC